MKNTLGFEKPAAETRVVVAMSGGVDSSLCAALLAEQGYEVIGITLQLYDYGQAVGKPGTCCAGQDIHDARRVADRIGIPHYVLDYESRFREAVIDDFADTYLAGATPIPCIRCNQQVKFQDLLDTAKDLGADCLATGHYIRRQDGPGGAELHRAVDAGRDQSYFLFATTQEQLDFCRFPLGDMPKAQVRDEAAARDLPVAEKPDSQDICFVPHGDYARVVRKLRPEADAPGDIVDLDGQVLGQHDGIVGYTIGQRRGLGIGGRADGDGSPLYVVRIDAATRQVVVGPRGALRRDRIALDEINWIGPAVPKDGLAVMVKLRSAHRPVAARIHMAADRQSATVVLEDAQFGVSPGQACVCYSAEGRVLGGGFIRGASLSAWDRAESGDTPDGRLVA